MGFLADIATLAMEPYNPEVLWIVILGFIIAFILAFAVGANDVANSFGTSVGSGVLTLRQACILATIFEILGAVLLGYKVSDTIRTGIIDVGMYEDNPAELMVGMLATLAGCAVWLLIATYFKLPVSGTHSTVAATVGYSLAARGFHGIKYMRLVSIIASWFVSPLLSGAISVVLFWLINRFILKATNPLKAALIGLPLIYGLTVFVNVFGVVNDGSKLLYLDNIPVWGAIVASVVLGFLVGLFVQFYIVPKTRKRIIGERVTDKPITPTFSTVSLESGNVGPSQFNSTAQLTPGSTNLADGSTPAEANRVFSFLQILTAIFGSFAHGGNDVSNAVGPLVALWMIYSEGSVQQEGETPWWILFFGGIGISVGLWVLGRRVIETVGTSLTKITPSTGFTIEIGAAGTVLLASKLGFPISTTHCKIGSVVFVGWAAGKFGEPEALPDPAIIDKKPEEKPEDESNGPTKEKPVNWKLFGVIIISWIATLPAAIAFAAFFMWLFSFAIL